MWGRSRPWLAGLAAPYTAAVRPACSWRLLRLGGTDGIPPGRCWLIRCRGCCCVALRTRSCLARAEGPSAALAQALAALAAGAATHTGARSGVGALDDGGDGNWG